MQSKLLAVSGNCDIVIQNAASAVGFDILCRLLLGHAGQRKLRCQLDTVENIRVLIGIQAEAADRKDDNRRHRTGDNLPDTPCPVTDRFVLSNRLGFLFLRFFV